MGASRRKFLQQLSLIGTFPFIDLNSLQGLPAQAMPGLEENKYGNLIEAPPDPADWPAFRNELRQWRTDKRKQLGYTGELYNDAAFHWASANFSCCFLMMYDLDFFDPAKNEYTIEKVIARGKKEFG